MRDFIGLGTGTRQLTVVQEGADQLIVDGTGKILGTLSAEAREK